LLLVGFGLGGVALAVGLTLAAFAFTGDDLGTPANPIVTGTGSRPRSTETPEAHRSSDDGPSATPTASDDHGGSSASEAGDDHGGGHAGSSDGGSDGSSGSGSSEGGSSGSDDGGDD
jgi:hypothetical protein